MCDLCDDDYSAFGHHHVKCLDEFDRRHREGLCKYCGEKYGEPNSGEHHTDCGTYRGYPGV